MRVEYDFADRYPGAEEADRERNATRGLATHAVDGHPEDDGEYDDLQQVRLGEGFEDVGADETKQEILHVR